MRIYNWEYNISYTNFDDFLFSRGSYDRVLGLELKQLPIGTYKLSFLLDTMEEIAIYTDTMEEMHEAQMLLLTSKLME